MLVHLRDGLLRQKFTCCHTKTEAKDRTFYLAQSQYTDTEPTSPNTDPIMPGAWQGSHWSANFEVTSMTRPGKNHVAAGFEPRIVRSRGRHLNHWANEAVGDTRIEPRVPRSSPTGCQRWYSRSTLPDAWRRSGGTKTGRPGVPRLGEIANLICNFYLSVAAGTLIRADPYLRYISRFLRRTATNQPTHLGRHC